MDQAFFRINHKEFSTPRHFITDKFKLTASLNNSFDRIENETI